MQVASPASSNNWSSIPVKVRSNRGIFEYLSTESNIRVWRQFEHFAKPFALVRLSGVVMFIPTLIAIHSYAVKLFTTIKTSSESKKERVINYSLHLFSEVSNLLYRTSALVQELKLLKLVSQGAASFAPLAMAVSAPLQLASLALNVQEWKSTKKAQEMSFNELQKKDEVWYKDNFWVENGKAVKEKLVESDMKVVRERLWSKKLCHVLYSISVVIGIIATTAFLFSPLAPIGYIFFTAVVVLEVAIWAYNSYAHHRFIHDIGITQHEKDTLVVRIYRYLFHPAT